MVTKYRTYVREQIEKDMRNLYKIFKVKKQEDYVKQCSKSKEALEDMKPTIDTDRELLELAAKAIGLEGEWSPSGLWHRHTLWNPLADDGDALRLAVALLLEIHIYHTGVSVRIPTGDKVVIEADQEPDPYAATRRAIVRAAAAIGKKT